MTSSIKSNISLELIDYVDGGMDPERSVLTIKVNKCMVQRTGKEAQQIFRKIKDIIDNNDVTNIEIHLDKNDIIIRIYIFEDDE